MRLQLKMPYIVVVLSQMVSNLVDVGGSKRYEESDACIVHHSVGMDGCPWKTCDLIVRERERCKVE